MRIVVAMDKFKGSLTAVEASQAVAEGLRAALPGVHVECIPIADGGEGTASAVHAALGGELKFVEVINAVGSRKVRAPVLFVAREERTVAVMEMSAAAGLELLQASERDPFKASTFGVGEMMRFAVEHGADEIMIGIGGSATNDGGTGMARALGYRFLAEAGAGNATDREVEDIPFRLEEVTTIQVPDRRPLQVTVTVACDVTNPLLGSDGATYIYAPQKGAQKESLPVLEKRMTCLAELADEALKTNFRDIPGAGAAGGLGYGLMTFAGAKLRNGFPLLAQLIGIEERIATADAVITGEGSIDAQTCNGKAPMGVAEMARRASKPVIAIGGLVDHDAVAALFDHTLSLVDASTSVEHAMTAASEVLRSRSREAAEWLTQS